MHVASIQMGVVEDDKEKTVADTPLGKMGKEN